MKKLLYIQASPQIERSASIAVAERFLEVYRAHHPDDTVETLDLWQADLPEFDGAIASTCRNSTCPITRSATGVSRTTRTRTSLTD